jgi:Skp family chaperone for outer membrane proteins
LLLVTLLGSPASAQTRIATVDMGKLFEGYYNNSDNDNDLTQAILDQLNASAPPEARKTPEKQTEKKTTNGKP